MVDRLRLDQRQVDAYFSRIGLGAQHRHQSVGHLTPSQQLDYLALLLTKHLNHVPFENLDLHYSRRRTVDIHLPTIFRKVIDGRRGGYCVETNLLFNSLLVSLGYDAFIVPSRVYDPKRARYMAMTHCLNLVVFGGDGGNKECYAADVGFGGNVATVPLHLAADEVQGLSGSLAARLRYDMIDLPAGRTKYWIYEHRRCPEDDWAPQYCFMADLELVPEDLQVTNMSTSTSRTSFFTQKILCLRFTAEDEWHAEDDVLNAIACDSSSRTNGAENEVGGVLNGNDQEDEKKSSACIDGVLILDADVLKWRKRGVKQWEMKLRSEGERTRALESFFGIYLSEEDKAAIMGTIAALPS